MNTKITIVLMVIVSIFAPVMGCGCDTIEKKDVEKKLICPEGYHLECVEICSVAPYPYYMDTYPTHIKEYCYKLCRCVPDDVEPTEPADVPTPRNNFAPTSVLSDVTTYTYFQNGERVTSTEMPLNPDGAVITTPANFNTKRTMQDFTGSIKQQRIDQWRANHAE